MKTELGEKVRDRLSGFEGVCTARAEYLYGVPRVEVTPVAKSGDKSDEPRWFEESRVEAA